MSLHIRQIGIDGFRKFREPITIDGLTAGLNIVIEPNETGKSTLLEALRAAFFVRHNTKNQLAQSFAPYGEAIGPEIKVAFEAGGTPYTVSKRFLRSPSVEVEGPQGRAQGDEAETRLNALLGSVRDSSRGGDVSTYGALGMLWVAQTEALAVSAPGQIVRDLVRSTLESEVGSIMGGPAYKRVRDRIDGQYETYWTPTSGQKRGRQIEAWNRLETAEAAARVAAERLAALEKNFTDIEAARTRLKVVQREMLDDADIQARKDLVASLEIARAAAQILATRRAEHEAVSGKFNSLEELQRRHEQVNLSAEKANTALAKIRVQREVAAKAVAAAAEKLTLARSALELARTVRKDARAALAAGEESLKQAHRKKAVAAARTRHADLLELERQSGEVKSAAANAISSKQLAELEANDRAIAEARAIANAGATRISLSGSTRGVTIDGGPMPLGDRTLTSETRIRFGDSELVVSPPVATASAGEALASAVEKQHILLDELGVSDLASARARNDAARTASAEVRTLDARIGAITPADPAINLAAGADALKLFIVSVENEVEDETTASTPNMAQLVKGLEEAETELARAEGSQEGALTALRTAEAEHAPLATAEVGVASDAAHAKETIEAIESRPEWKSLADTLADVRQQAASASVKLEEATRDASAHDPNAITRKIEMIDARSRTTAEAKSKLETEIARLEGTIDSEGGKGLAEREAASHDEVESARAALDRITEEADTLKVLREVLDEARDETSAKFVGPVAKRAKRHIERLLPGCELAFSEDLALASVARGGVEEYCGTLSKGTQEQLAILTRIAFADILLEEGKPVSLILDDPLAYSDDARLDLMIEVLLDAATRMQVILLTCRDRAFRHVPGTRLTLRKTA